MQYFENYADKRLFGRCVHCGGDIGTADHVISKVLLDRPYPENLPTIDACAKCNNDLSLDEEYLACFLECCICGTTDPSKLSRSAIARILMKKPSLINRIENSKKELHGLIYWNAELDRVKKVILKLARAHALYEIATPELEDPLSVSIRPFALMSEQEIAEFESTPECNVWPEVGSRAMHRICVGEPQTLPWIIVQENRYRYLVSYDYGTLVRIVLSEYLACEVRWQE